MSPLRPRVRRPKANGAGPAPRARGTRRQGPSNEELGQRIRYIRISLGLTLKELSDRGGISATHVSEIERGKASPTVRALGRIAHALGLPAATLVESSGLQDSAIGRAAERGARVLRLGEGTIEPLTDHVEGTSIGAYLLLLPAGREPALTHTHTGEEWLTVLSGKVDVRVKGERYVLCEGDSLHFRAHSEHSYGNPGTEVALLFVASRPRMAL